MFFGSNAPVAGDSVVEVEIDPSLDFLSPLVGGVELHSKLLRLAPGHRSANADPGQRHQGKRHFDVRPSRKFFDALHRQSPSTHFDAGGADASAIAND